MTRPKRRATQAPSNHAHLAGWLDLLGTAVGEAAPRVQRAHLQIADTVFTQLDRLSPAQPVVHTTRVLHHLIAGLAYTSVRYGGNGLSYLARRRFKPATALPSGGTAGSAEDG
jgi:hypothetical protein